VCRTASLVKVCFQIEETQLRGGSIPVQATNLVSAVGSQTQKPVNLRLGLPDVYAGNRASDDQSLDFASPLEDRVDLRVHGASARPDTRECSRNRRGSEWPLR